MIVTRSRLAALTLVSIRDHWRFSVASRGADGFASVFWLPAGGL
jgi:hypothetical protein